MGLVPHKKNDVYGGFLKWGYPQIIHFSGIFPYKPTIWEYPHLWKPSYSSVVTFFLASKIHKRSAVLILILEANWENTDAFNIRTIQNMFWQAQVYVGTRDYPNGSEPTAM